MRAWLPILAFLILYVPVSVWVVKKKKEDWTSPVDILWAVWLFVCIGITQAVYVWSAS